MSTTPRQIRLTFPETGESVIADFLESQAPQICDLVWNMLPIEKKMIHGMYSGPEVFMVLDSPQPIPHENEVQLPLPGEVLFFYDPGTSSAGGNRAVNEICVVYSRGVALKQHEAVPTFASAFARITGDYSRDWIEFASACRRIRTERTAPMRIERV